MTFYSASARLRIWTARGVVRFENHKYETKDIEMVNILKSHKGFNSKGLGSFTTMKVESEPTPVVAGTRGAGSHTQPDEEPAAAEKVTPEERFESLKTKVLDKEGKIKKNFVKKADVEEFKNLYHSLYGKEFGAGE